MEAIWEIYTGRSVAPTGDRRVEIAGSAEKAKSEKGRSLGKKG